MELTDEQILLLIEALDSHRYWQVAEPHQKQGGEVIVTEADENYEEFYACATLEMKLEKERARRDMARKEGH